MITESVLKINKKHKKNKKKHYDKNLKKRTNEDISAGDNVLIYDHSHKRNKGTSLKPKFKGSYTVEIAKKNSFKANVNGKLETCNRKNLWKGMQSFI